MATKTQDTKTRDLMAAGCEETFSERVSAVAQRDRLKEALRFVRRGDTLVVCKPDRLARSTTDLLRIVEDLDRRGVGMIMLSMGGQRIDTRAPTGKLMITMLGAIAEFERGLLLERQREGVAKAKQDGKYRGRKPKARAKAAEVLIGDRPFSRGLREGRRFGSSGDPFVCRTQDIVDPGQRGSDFSLESYVHQGFPDQERHTTWLPGNCRNMPPRFPWNPSRPQP